MRRAQHAKVQEYVDECTASLGLSRVRISYRKADHLRGLKGALAAFGLDTRHRPTIYLSDAWWRLPPHEKRSAIAHELIHARLLPATRLVNGWLARGLITERQLDTYTAREEQVTYALEAALSRLLPEWFD